MTMILMLGHKRLRTLWRAESHQLNASAHQLNMIAHKHKLAIADNNRGNLRYAVKDYKSAIAYLQTASQLLRPQRDIETYQKIQQASTQLQALPK